MGADDHAVAPTEHPRPPRPHVPAHPESIALARRAAVAADDKKGRDLTILDVADVLALVDCFLIVTGGSERQLKAIADAIEEAIRTDLDRRPKRREGTAGSGWFLLDYGDVVCHLFSDEQREYYDLDQLWADVDRHDALEGAAAASSPEAAFDASAGA